MAFLKSIRFLSTIPYTIVREAVLPFLLGAAAFYFLLYWYLDAVAVHLVQPSGGSASRILGIVALGVLVMIFFHSQVVCAVAAVLVPARGGSFFGIKQHQWRLYVATLQLLLLICVYACVFWSAVTLAEFLAFSVLPKAILYISLFSILFWVMARFWFFLLPLSVNAGEVEILRMAWHFSSGHFWAIAIAILLIFLVTVPIHLALQFALLQMGVIPPLPRSLSLASALDVHRSVLLPFVLLVSGTYLPAVVLSAFAQIFLYNEIAGTKDTIANEG